MNDLRKLARIILIGLAVYMLVTWGITFIAALPYFVFADSQWRPIGFGQLLSALSGAVYVGVVFYVLVRKADLWSAKIVGFDEPRETRVWWVPFAFRLTMIFTGLLCLYWVIPRIISGFARYYFYYRKYEASRGNLTLYDVVGWIIQLGLGIYLVCGAPHFVRWQVKKTLEHCKRWEEADSISDQEAGV